MIIAKVKTLTAGWQWERGEVQGLGWKIGDTFEVEDISVGRSSSYVNLKEFGSFNTVFFDFFEDGVELNIYTDKRFDSYSFS